MSWTGTPARAGGTSWCRWPADRSTARQRCRSTVSARGGGVAIRIDQRSDGTPSAAGAPRRFPDGPGGAVAGRGTSRWACWCRVEPTRFQYTVKDVGRPVSADLDLARAGSSRSMGRRVRRPGPRSRQMALPRSRGTGPPVRHPAGRSSSAGGGPTAPGSTENALFVDGRLNKIDEELPWSYDPPDWLRPWRITGPRVQAEFHPFHEQATRTKLGLLANDTNQCFGQFTGWAHTDDGTSGSPSTVWSAGPRRRTTAGSSCVVSRSSDHFELWTPPLRVYDRQPRTGTRAWPLGSARSRGEVRDGEPRGVRLLGARTRRGRDPAGDAARAGPRRGAGPEPATPGSAGAPRRWSSAATCPPSQYARDARAVSGGRLPRPGEVRLPQRRRRRAGPAGAARAHGLLPVPAPDRVRRAGRRRGRRCPTACRPRGRCSPARWRPPSTRCGTRRRWSATGSPSSARAWSAAASPALLARFPGVAGRAGRRRPARGPAVAAALGVEFAAPGRRRPAGATWSCTPAPPPPGCSASLDLLAPEGTVSS